MGIDFFGSGEVEVFSFNGFVQKSWIKANSEFSVRFFNYYKSVNPVGWFLNRFIDIQVSHAFQFLF